MHLSQYCRCPGVLLLDPRRRTLQGLLLKMLLLRILPSQLGCQRGSSFRVHARHGLLGDHDDHIFDLEEVLLRLQLCLRLSPLMVSWSPFPSSSSCCYRC